MHNILIIRSLCNLPFLEHTTINDCNHKLLSMDNLSNEKYYVSDEEIKFSIKLDYVGIHV